MWITALILGFALIWALAYWGAGTGVWIATLAIAGTALVYEIAGRGA